MPHRDPPTLAISGYDSSLRTVYSSKSNPNPQIQLIGNISLVLCFLTILRFYKVNKSLMTVHQPILKLLSFKLIVFVIFLQDLIFNFIPTPTGLSSHGTVSPRDIKYGLPSFLVCVEMVIFSAGFHFTFRSRMYHPSERGSDAAMSLPAAAWDAANPSDFLMDIMQLVSTTTATSAKYAQQPSPAYGRISPTATPLVPHGAEQRAMSPLNMPPGYTGPRDQPEYSYEGAADHLGVDTAYRPQH